MPQNAGSLVVWWKEVEQSAGSDYGKYLNSLCKDLKLKGERETKIVDTKAEQVDKAIKLYIHLLSERDGALSGHISELLCIADKLDKVSKGTKIAGITGGATSVAGGVAAAAGVILSPFTLGASLALTVIGVGVAAAGGVTGASAVIANKVNVAQDQKKIDRIFHEYEQLMVDIQNCLKFLNKSMEQLKQHDQSVLNEAIKESERADRVVKLATTGGASAKALEVNSKASGLIQGFAIGMDMYFTQGKNGQKLKKGLESKFAMKIRTLAEELNKGLDELRQMKTLFLNIYQKNSF
ncbi:apolipoprotein L3-like [Mastacembelus armatus]|uniref:apolipoprotein L3-like n=1 Tax=Mastacembelus armatus TaxID=205130 RepID=UPI000E45D42D|nr:apolipoprotein L3-like [Mastacembelus armatus]